MLQDAKIQDLYFSLLPIAIFAEIWYNVTNREVCFVNLGETYMSLPNDLSGSASKNRFRLELLWGISKMFDIYDKDDFTIVFDNVCDIEIHFKSELEFYQIKTHKVQKPYTFAKISKPDQDTNTSILGKLYILKKNNIDISIALVSNAFFKLDDKIYSECEKLDFNTLDESSKKKIKDVLKKEVGEEIDLNNFYYIYTPMNLLEPENDLKGRILGFFENVKNCEPRKPNALYRLIYETAKEKACYELDSLTYDDLVKNKGLTKAQLNKMLDKYVDRTDVSVESVKSYIETSKDLNERRKLKKALVDVVGAMYSSNELKQKEIEIASYLLENENSLLDDIEDEVDLLINVFGEKFSLEYRREEIYVFMLLVLKRWEDGMYDEINL